MTMSVTKLWVWMDVSAACNLACRDCYTKHAHENHVMSLADFRTILERLASTSVAVQRLHLNWRAEPLINKHLSDFLSARREILPNVSLEFHTNGILLNERICSEIISEALENDLFYVSLDGGNREAHEANRGRGTWEQTLKGLTALLDARDRAPTTPPRVGIYEIFYGNRTRFDRELLALTRRCDEWTRVSVLRSDGAEACYDGDTVPFAPCFWAGNSFAITAKGDVHVCLLSFQLNGLLGNLLNDDLTSVLDRAKAFRNQIATNGRSRVAHCSNCKKCAGEIDDV